MVMLGKITSHITQYAVATSFTERTNKMATELYNDCKDQLTKAEKELNEAKAAVTAFEGDEDEGQRLKTLRRRVHTGLSDDERDEKKRLEKKEERLEAEVVKSRDHVRMLQGRLRLGQVTTL